MLTDESIKRYRQEIDDLKKDNTHESETCVVLINPILGELGWPVRNRNRVKTQYQIPKLENDNDGKVDYALIDGERNPVVFVEAKSLGNHLGGKELEQLINYGSNHILDRGTQNFAFLVLTNGDAWKFYLLWHEKGGLNYYRDWEYGLSIERSDISEVTENLNKLLTYQEVLDGGSQRHLVNLFLQDRIKKTYKSILSEPDEELVNLVAKKMTEKGYEPNQEEIKRVISGAGTPLPPPPPPAPPGPGPGPDPVPRPRLKLRVECFGETVKGRNATEILGYAIALIADHCDGGIDKVHKACAWSNIPLVMTDEEVGKQKVHRPYFRTYPVPNYSGYNYFTVLSSTEKVARLNELARALGISERVKVDLVEPQYG